VDERDEWMGECQTTFVSMPFSSVSNLRNVVMESHLLALIESWVRDIDVGS
jgi:hypothetical protein